VVKGKKGDWGVAGFFDEIQDSIGGKENMTEDGKGVGEKAEETEGGECSV